MRHPLDIDLFDFVEGNPSERPVEKHLARCELCRIKVARMRSEVSSPPGAVRQQRTRPAPRR